MPFTVVLDTCVLYPAHLRDTLLRLAERNLYTAHWSADILDELYRNLVEVGIAPAVVQRLIGEMRNAFPDAEVFGYGPLMRELTCHPKDRHVLAAAVRANAAAIVTFNTADFPPASVEPFDIEVITPDTFLLDQLDLAPRAVLDELQRQAAANRREPKTVRQILDALCAGRGTGIRRRSPASDHLTGPRVQQGWLRVPRTRRASARSWPSAAERPGVTAGVTRSRRCHPSGT